MAKTAFNRFLRTVKDHTYPNRVIRRLALRRRFDFLPLTDSSRKEIYSQALFRRSSAACFAQSQLGQDLFVLEMLNFREGGFFVEIGAGNGKLLSNTYLLEKRFGWSRILCEPNPVFHASIRSLRSATLDKRAVFGETGRQMRFQCCQELSTLSRYKDGDFHLWSGSEIDIETVSLTDLLAQHRAPGAIDYLSIDTEGSELNILSAFDFGRFNVSVLTIEHNFVEGRIQALDHLLLPAGYARIHSEMSQFDAWYVLRELL